LAVGHCTDGLRTLVLVSQEIVQSAQEFIDFKFSWVPKGAGAFIWTRNGHAPGGLQVSDEEVESDSSRFMRMMRYYEAKLC